MNRRISIALVAALAITLAGAPAARAEPNQEPAMMAVDAIVVRPVGVAVTVVCAAAFVVALPFAAIAGEVPNTAEKMVAKPARLLFDRPLGDFDRMRNASVNHTPGRER